MIKKTLFLFIVSLSPLLAQKIELGAGAGITHYKGDLYPTFKPWNFNVGTNLLARYNFDKALSFKAGTMIGWVSADEKKSGNPANESRGLIFKHLLWEWNGQVEYNFLNFRSTDRVNSNWTPYLFGGGGAYYLPHKKFISPDGGVSERSVKLSPSSNILFGVAIKKAWKSQWNFGIEFGTRVLLNKKYSDSFDGLVNNREEPGGKLGGDYSIPSTMPAYHNYHSILQPDKYFYTNFYISYVFYKVYCPPAK